MRCVPAIAHRDVNTAICRLISDNTRVKYLEFKLIKLHYLKTMLENSRVLLETKRARRSTPPHAVNPPQVGKKPYGSRGACSPTHRRHFKCMHNEPKVFSVLPYIEINKVDKQGLAYARGPAKRARKPPEDTWSLPPMDVRNPREVISALSAY
ncbi:hypothetical protein EVAR_43537_1 [Eumeta japonica]|uniref:Uncharacterized protein n=1 Tax=Eumeta variegata TaxID=151549 RepID=A0A4C1W8X8_EUMVA|nr:hypothetical protein EVAR_43537_1 [Eumeta japonica]